MGSKGTYVVCTVSKGSFDSEYYVRVANASAYVSKRRVKVKSEPEGQPVPGHVQVHIVSNDPQRKRALVELSGEPVVGLRTWVDRSQLVPA
jgi:hypothetical protein